MRTTCWQGARTGPACPSWPASPPKPTAPAGLVFVFQKDHCARPFTILGGGLGDNVDVLSLECFVVGENRFARPERLLVGLPVAGGQDAPIAAQVHLHKERRVLSGFLDHIEGGRRDAEVAKVE